MAVFRLRTAQDRSAYRGLVTSIPPLTHDAVRAIGGSRAGGGAVVIRPAPSPTCSVEAGHGRKAGADIRRRV